MDSVKIYASTLSVFMHYLLVCSHIYACDNGTSIHLVMMWFCHKKQIVWFRYLLLYDFCVHKESH